jgi:uncharacterized membrane protein
MFRPSDSIQNLAFFTLIFGALSDWVSTEIGLSLGMVEGNTIAAFLMSQNKWIEVDAILIFVCFIVPFLVSRFSEEKTPKNLFLFPLVAGLLKLGVSLWNISLILI